MKVVALISGGKDSCYNMMHCVAQGHEIVALANLKPKVQDELDSFMFQTVGHHVIDLYAEAMGLPLFRREINGGSVCQDMIYTKDDTDEVEDMYKLLKDIKEKIEFDAVSSGAILSNYQRIRVENVCSRLGVQSLGYLWRRDQVDLLDEMIESGLHAILIKVATLGLEPKKHLGKSLNEMQPHLLKMKEKFQLNVCGEGGEYETMTLDCPLFTKKIVIDEQELVIHSDDAFAAVGYLSFKKMHLENKPVDPALTFSQRLGDLKIPDFFEKGVFIDLVDSIESKDIVSDINVDLACTKKMKAEHSCFQYEYHRKGDKAYVTELYCFKEGTETVEESAIKTMDTLKNIILENGNYMADITLVHLYCADMGSFAKINSIYKRYFNSNPPARVCVEIPLPETTYFKIDVLIHVGSSKQRQTLHVQSISYWAPANIGPYSQAVKVGSEVFFSGSIGMCPSSMHVIDDSVVKEAMLALQHVQTVARVISPTMESTDCAGCVICYVTDESFTSVVKKVFESQKLFHPDSYLLNIVCIPGLPRNARVEWHIISNILSDELLAEDATKISLDMYEESTYHIAVQLKDKDLNENFYTTVSKLLQEYGKLRKCNFIQVYYATTKFVCDKPTVQKAFNAAFSSINTEVPAISYIPVSHGRSTEIGLSICGHNL